MKSRTSMVCEEHFKTEIHGLVSGITILNEVLNTFRSNLKKFEHLYEGTAIQGNPTLLNEIYTELYITESESGEISNEHEGKRIGTSSLYFHFLSEKSTSKTLSLSDLLHVFFPEIKEMETSSDKVLFIFESVILDFKSKVKLCNISKSASVDVLLMNLIVGNLLPSALIWITSRPAAADLVPSECVHRVTEVRGFNEPQKEEYFRKRISDQSLADRIISHLKSLRSLYIMCHIPVFCWISATVLEKMLSRAESGEIPKTLTQMYTHFLILQTNIKHEKDYEKKVTDEDVILKLGKVAFQQLVKRNLIYGEDLRECGIDVTCHRPK
ncbi:protein NLRC3-like [Labeo rohita]|uniref:protein NLRC3-like n=1 Tax=Labeo rohita TaxID=84645 RepID=UPI0021E2293F|nr:protein NLRC3-like [Labeo rohita]